MRIVCQAHEVTAEFLCPTEQGVGIFCAVGTSAAVGFFLVYAYTAKEYRFAIEQELLAACLDGTETYAIANKIAYSGSVLILTVKGQGRR